MAGGGYTPDEIDTMPMQDALALLSLWRKTPPAHEILAAVYFATPAIQPAPDDPSGIGNLIRRQAPDTLP